MHSSLCGASSRPPEIENFTVAFTTALQCSDNCQLSKNAQYESTELIPSRGVDHNCSIDQVREADGKGIITVTTLVCAT